LSKDIGMTIAKLLQNFENVTNAQLRMAEDFDKYLNQLLHAAKDREKGEPIKPTSGCKEFAHCVTAHNHKLMLWYNAKSGTTRVIELDVY
jgi:hypothetical protein